MSNAVSLMINVAGALRREFHIDHSPGSISRSLKNIGRATAEVARACMLV